MRYRRLVRSPVGSAADRGVFETTMDSDPQELRKRLAESEDAGEPHEVIRELMVEIVKAGPLVEENCEVLSESR